MKRCLLCQQWVNQHQAFRHWLSCDTCLCGDCQKMLHRLHTTRMLAGMKLHILYEYDDFLENLLFQYKEGGDVALRSLFFYEDKRYLEKRYKGYTLLLMPSGKEKTKERGFHALAEMTRQLQLPILQPFYKSENRKQSTLSYEQRQHIGDIMHLDEHVVIKGKKLLLVDDVCTSGATLHSAYQLIKDKGVTTEALALCAHPLFLKQHPKTL